jgi:hypothetical protein
MRFETNSKDKVNLPVGFNELNINTLLNKIRKPKSGIISINLVTL